MTTEQLAITVTADTESVAAVRHFVRDAARTLGAPIDLDVAELLASELAANAVGLAAGEITVTVSRRAGGLRVEVRDFGYGHPEAARPAPFDPQGGRGLLLVDSLSASWGVDEFLPGKIVWFEVAADPGRVGLAGSLGARSVGGGLLGETVPQVDQGAPDDA